MDVPGTLNNSRPVGHILIFSRGRTKPNGSGLTSGAVPRPGSAELALAPCQQLAGPGVTRTDD